MNKLNELMIIWLAYSFREKLEVLLLFLIFGLVLLIFFLWAQCTFLPIVRLSNSISLDANQDDIITISDIWLLIREMFYEPGASLSERILTEKLLDPSLINFFEIDTSKKYNLLSFIISFILFIPLTLHGFFTWQSSEKKVFDFFEAIFSTFAMMYGLFLFTYICGALFFPMALKEY